MPAVVTRLLIEYDGTNFAGWASQPGERTVQHELEVALTTLLGQQVRLTVAGRTDRGVHAWGQVASYPGPLPRLEGVNALTPHDIVVKQATEEPDGFDARRDARSRTYCFRVLARRAPSAFERNRALHWPHRIDRDLLHEAAHRLTGTHDFTAFTPTETDHVRFERDVYDARWVDKGEILEFWITADAFMRHMNRVLVGTMLQVAGDKRTLESFEQLLQGRPREDAGPTAPPHGLYFAKVEFRGANEPRRGPQADDAE